MRFVDRCWAGHNTGPLGHQSRRFPQVPRRAASAPRGPSFTGALCPTFSTLTLAASYEKGLGKQRLGQGLPAQYLLSNPNSVSCPHVKGTLNVHPHLAGTASANRQ